jgi:hypothetical protein
MVNHELVELCRTVIGAIQETDNFDAPTLRRLIIHIVPQLLAELDIMERVLETVRLPDPIPDEAEIIEVEAEPVRKKDKKKRGKRGRK